MRGKYYQRYQQGTNVVLLDPDVAQAFKDSQSVNRALRLQLAASEIVVPAPVAQEIGRRGPGDPAARAIATTAWLHTVAMGLRRPRTRPVA